LLSYSQNLKLENLKIEARNFAHCSASTDVQ